MTALEREWYGPRVHEQRLRCGENFQLPFVLLSDRFRFRVAWLDRGHLKTIVELAPTVMPLDQVDNGALLQPG